MVQIRIDNDALLASWIEGTEVHDDSGTVAVGKIISTHQDERGWYAEVDLYPVALGIKDVDPDSFG